MLGLKGTMTRGNCASNKSRWEKNWTGEALAELKSSPFRPDTREEAVGLQKLDEERVSGEPINGTQSSPLARSPPIRNAVKDDTVNTQKLRSLPRVSLGLESGPSKATTHRKRSFDQTPQDHDEGTQSDGRAKKKLCSTELRVLLSAAHVAVI
jgi:hypothetical protein